jgi:hypothetical protein
MGCSEQGQKGEELAGVGLGRRDGPLRPGHDVQAGVRRFGERRVADIGDGEDLGTTGPGHLHEGEEIR